ncbi:MAG: transcriptional regulator, partial [Halothiobacillaceae bacterium]
MVTQVARRAQTRAKIIQAAKKLFDKQGFEATSVDQIVARANVAKGTFYQYYETKVEVLADVTRDEGAEKSRQALESVVNGAAALPVLEDYLVALCQWFERHEKVAEALIFASFKTRCDEAYVEPHRYTRTFLFELMRLAQQQGVIRRDIPAAELAKVLGGSLVGSVLGWCKDPQPG